MDDMELTSTVAEDVADTSVKKRPRKKYLYSQILQQMEFYFSDANLAKDRFLSQLLSRNNDVPLETFLRFNKIRALTGSTEDIAKALGSSQFLKVTEDGKCVYRTTAIQKKENQDDCTIYVEQLPLDANHDWVIGIFSAYGKVEYVSIPKYKNRAAIKGFAFVEFDTPEAAKKALEAFGSVGCCLPPQIPPEELCSIATFQTGDLDKTNEMDESDINVPEKQAKNNKKKNKMLSNEVEETGVDSEHEKELPETENEEPISKKLKIEVDEHQGGEKSKKKKRRKDLIDKEDNQQELLEDNILEGEVTESIKTKKSKKRKLESENTGNLLESKDCNQEAASDNAPNKKKKKKNLTEEEVVDERDGTGENQVSASGRNKNKKKHLQVEDDTEDTKSYPEEMEDNIDLQQTKKSKKKKKKRDVENEDKADKGVEDAEDEGTSVRTQKQTDEDVEEDEDNNETGTISEKSDKKKRKRKKNKKIKSGDKKENDPTTLGLRIFSKNEWRRLRNKYLNLQREKMQGLKKHLARAKFGSSYQSPYPVKENGHQVVKDDPKAKKTDFLPGVIIHIDLTEPLGDMKTFKTVAKSHQGVSYVDATEGGYEVHIRCSSAKDAQKMVGEKPWENMQILEGTAEMKYWKKVWEDRENKIKNKVRVNVRGREKLLKRAERELGKHIKFDD